MARSVTTAVTAPDTVTIPRRSWEMAQFEIHLLRDIVTGIWLNDAVRGRLARTARATYQADLMRAMEDPEFRRGHRPIRLPARRRGRICRLTASLYATSRPSGR